jgi:hypothetical protein
MPHDFFIVTQTFTTKKLHIHLGVYNFENLNEKRKYDD